MHLHLLYGPALLLLCSFLFRFLYIERCALSGAYAPFTLRGSCCCCSGDRLHDKLAVSILFINLFMKRYASLRSLHACSRLVLRIRFALYCRYAFGFARSLRSEEVTICTHRSLTSFAHYLTFGKGANGGCGGKEAKPPAPPTASQQK